MGTATRNPLQPNEKLITEGPCLAHRAKEKETLVTTDASKTGLGITLWQKQDDRNKKPIAFGSRHLNGTKKIYSIDKLKLLAAVCELEKIPILIIQKESLSLHRSSSVGTS